MNILHLFKFEAGRATSIDVSDQIKKKERLKKAKLFVKRGRNQFSVTDLEDNLPNFQNQE